jgi:hypothetical protein
MDGRDLWAWLEETMLSEVWMPLRNTQLTFAP